MKPIITLSVLFLFIFCANAQNQIIFEETRPEAFLVRYESGNANLYKNQIITEISKYIPKTLQQTEYKFSYNQYCRIIRNGYNLEIMLRLTDINLSGDINYKGFSMADVLFPETLSCKIVLKNELNKRMQTVDINNIVVSNNPATIVNEITPDSSLNNTHWAEITNKQFNYTERNLEQFIAKAEVIENYLKTDREIQLAFQELEVINPENPEALFEYKRIVDNVELTIEKIKAWGFFEKLNLTEYDPINFERKFNDLIDLHGRLKVDVNYMLSHLHEVYYNKGMEFLSLGNTEMAKLNFNKAVNTNIRFAPAHYQLAVIEYNDGNLDQTRKIIANIIGKMDPDPETRNESLRLAEEVVKRMVDEGSRLNQLEKFDNAEYLLSEAQIFCNTIVGLYCGQSISSELDISIKGKYEHYLRDVEKAIQDKNFHLADEKLRTARVYQRNHSGILSLDLLHRTASILISSYSLAADNELVTKNYQRALDIYDNIADICSANNMSLPESIDKGRRTAHKGVYMNMLEQANSVVVTNKFNAKTQLEKAVEYRHSHNLEIAELESRIEATLAQFSCADYVNEGKNLTGQKQYNLALTKFEQALILAEKYSFANEKKEIDILIFDAAKSYALRELEIGRVQVENNNLSVAGNHYKAALKLADKYNLNSDNETALALKELKDKIFTQECMNAQNEFDGRIEKAREQIQKKQYVNADKILDAAITFAGKNEDCSISIVVADEIKAKIAPGVAYQKQLAKVEEYIEARYYSKCVELYLELGRIYEAQNAGKLGIEHADLYTFIRKTNSSFVNYAVGYYTDEGDLQKALSLLKLLEERMYNKAETKAVQVNLGNRLARKDHTDNPQSNPKEKVLEYTGGSKYFNVLKKIYIKVYKGL